MKLRAWILPVGTGIMGLVVGLLMANRVEQSVPQFSSSSAVSTGTPSSVVATRNVSGNVTCDVTTASLAEMRQSIREELNTFMKQQTPLSHVAADKHIDKIENVLTENQVAAASRADSLINFAIGRHQWTQQDAEQLRKEFGTMTASQRAEVLQKFSVAVNRGQLIPETDELPF